MIKGRKREEQLKRVFFLISVLFFYWWIETKKTMFFLVSFSLPPKKLFTKFFCPHWGHYEGLIKELSFFRFFFIYRNFIIIIKSH